MANKHETLVNLFTDIADAIREKTGGTENIVADNFPDEILNIQTKEDLDAELTEQDRLLDELETVLSGKAIPEEGGAWVPETQKLIVSYDCQDPSQISINYVKVEEDGRVSQAFKGLFGSGSEEFIILKDSIFIFEENDGGGPVMLSFDYAPSTEIISINYQTYFIDPSKQEGSITITTTT